MLYSILILDDEPLILEGLTQKLDWSALHCEVVGCALNGMDGMRLMDELHPDIVISDIRMPGYTGIELAEHNFKSLYRAKFIILSAYNDFEFAQKAIRYQVEDYILKPIDSLKLLEAVRCVVQKLEEDQSQKQKVIQLEEEVKVSKELASASLLFNLARYREGGEGTEKLFLKEHLLFRSGVFICAKIYNIHAEGEHPAMGMMQSQVVEKMREYGHLVLRGSADDKLIFLCQTNSSIAKSTARQRIVESARKTMEYIGAENGVLCICVISPTYDSTDQLNELYHESLRQLKYSFFEIKSGVLENVWEKKPVADVDIYPLLHHLKHGNVDEMKREFCILTKCVRNIHDVDFAMHTLKELRHQATRIASNAGMLEKPQMNHSYIDLNFSQLCSNVEEYLILISTYVSTGQNLIGKVKLLVEEQYSDCSLGLASVADWLGISSSYLSRLFKKESGENFVDYLADVRIRKAIHLLETTKMKNGEIAEAVGFDDERYFGKVFKKKCMMTPKQHREKNSRKIT